MHGLQSGLRPRCKAWRKDHPYNRRSPDQRADQNRATARPAEHDKARYKHAKIDRQRSDTAADTAEDSTVAQDDIEATSDAAAENDGRGGRPFGAAAGSVDIFFAAKRPLAVTRKGASHARSMRAPIQCQTDSCANMRNRRADVARPDTTKSPRTGPIRPLTPQGHEAPDRAEDDQSASGTAPHVIADFAEGPLAAQEKRPAEWLPRRSTRRSEKNF
jgi:hypothetical protein